MKKYKTNRSHFIGDDANAITILFISKKDSKKRLSRHDPDSRLVILSHKKKNLCVFMTENINTKDIIELIEINKLKQ